MHQSRPTNLTLSLLIPVITVGADPVHNIWHKPSKSVGLFVLAISAALVTLVLGAVWALGNGQHRTRDGCRQLAVREPAGQPGSGVYRYRLDAGQ